MRRSRFAISAIALLWSLTVVPQGHAAGGSCPAQGNVIIRASDDIRIIETDGVARTYCLDAHDWDLGIDSVEPDNGDVIWGRPVSVLNGDITAYSKLHISGIETDDHGVIKGKTSGMTLTVRNVELYGSCCSDLEGSAGINGIGRITDLTVSYSDIHGNSNAGIVGVGGGTTTGLSVDHSEIWGNGLDSSGYDAGIKTIHWASVTNSYLHDNFSANMWWDCDAPGGVFTGNTSTGAAPYSGVFGEISSGDVESGEEVPTGYDYEFTISDNTITGNNIGINIVSSMHVDVRYNVVTNNTTHDIWIYQGDVNGHSGCTSGFEVADVTVFHNAYGPQDILGCSLPGVTCADNVKIKR